MPFKSEKQRKYLWANEPEIARDWTDTYGSRIEKDDGGIMHQFENYARDDGDNVSVPKTFQARAGSEPVDLAYVTPREQGILQSLKPGTPHEGPMGIPNYDSFDVEGRYSSSAAPEEKGAVSFDKGQMDRREEIKSGKWDADVKKKTDTWKKDAKTKRKDDGWFSKIGDKYKGFKASKNRKQIEYLKKQDLNAVISRLNKKGYTDFKKGVTTAEDIQSWLGTLSPQHPAMQPGGDASLVERWQDMKDKKGDPLFDQETIEKWEKSDYVPNYPGKTGVTSLDFLGNFLGTPDFSKNQIQNYLDTIKDIEGSGDLSYMERMKKFEPRRWAQQETTDMKWNPVQGKFEIDTDRGEGGPEFQPGYKKPVVPGDTDPDPDDGSDDPTFQDSLKGTGLPFKDYYVGGAPTAANLAWGQQFGVDPRTMGRTTWAHGGRIGRAYGGIMDTETGRRAYGLGSIFKKIGRAAKKVFKSPIGKMALMGGLGLYGANAGWFGATNPFFGKTGYLAPFLRKNIAAKGMPAKWGGYSLGKLGIGAASALPFFMGGGDDDDDGFDYEGAKNAYRDEMMRIKAGALAGTLDPNKFNYLGVKDGGRIGLSNGGDPLLRDEYDKYVFEMDEMGLEPMSFEKFAEQARAGMYAGGQSIPSDYTMEDAMMTTTQDKLGGITDVMKQADMYRQGDVGQFYAADGGRIRYAGGSGNPPTTMGQPIQAPNQLPNQPPRPNPMPVVGNPMARGMNPMMGGMNPMMNRPMMNRPMMNQMMGGRRMAQEGGLMDLGGMEKDYRQEGGFVPLGGEEKADDVPARLSKNEFVFTADAVRGAGGGDIDKGAEIMENIMKNLEEGGDISEETQGLAGAQEMFDVSERLSEVV